MISGKGVFAARCEASHVDRSWLTPNGGTDSSCSSLPSVTLVTLWRPRTDPPINRSTADVDEDQQKFDDALSARSGGRVQRRQPGCQESAPCMAHRQCHGITSGRAISCSPTMRTRAGRDHPFVPLPIPWVGINVQIYQ